MKKLIVIVACAALAAMPVAGAVSTEPASAYSKAPNVRCMRLDRAEQKLHRLHFRTAERGGGMFGIVVKANWVVVHQRQSGRTVVLTVGRYC